VKRDHSYHNDTNVRTDIHEEMSTDDEGGELNYSVSAEDHSEMDYSININTGYSRLQVTDGTHQRLTEFNNNSKRWSYTSFVRIVQLDKSRCTPITEKEEGECTESD